MWPHVCKLKKKTNHVHKHPFGYLAWTVKIIIIKKIFYWNYWKPLTDSIGCCCGFFFLSELTNVLHQCENLHCVNYRTGVITAREEKLKQLRSCVSVGIATECMNTLKTGCPASESDSTPPAYLQLHSRHSSHSQVCPEALSHAVWSFRDRRSFKFNLFCSDAWSTPKILQQSCIESSPETVAGRTEVNSQGVRARLAKQERCRI